MTTLLLAIVAVLLPPLAVALKVGLGAHFWINLVLTLLFWAPGMVHALLIVFEAIPAHRV